MWPFKRRQPSGLYQRRDGKVSMLPNWSAPPQRNTQEWIKTFRENPRLAVVERIASDLSFAAGKLYEVDNKGNRREVKKHPFLNFWNNPNPLHEFSNAALWRLFEIYLLLKGEGYFIIERNVMGQPAELWPVPVHWVQMTPYAGFPFYTVRLTGGQIMQISVDDMFIMKDLDPFNPFERGLGQSEAIADEVEIDEYAAKFQKKFFYNDATPNLIIGMPGSSDEQRKRFRAEWMERFKGMFNSHGVATVNGEVTVNKLSENMKDMDMIQGRTFLRNAVLEHYGVPREIMGITESSNRATSEAAQFIYAQNVLMPQLKRRQEAVNQQLLPVFGEDLIWEYDDIVPRNQEFDKAKAIEGWGAGLLTRNQALELLDMPTEKNGDVYKATYADVFISKNEDPTKVSTDMAELQYGDPGAEAPDESEGVVFTSSDGFIKTLPASYSVKARRIKAISGGMARVSRQQEKQFERATMKFFTEQRQRICLALSAPSKAEGSLWDIISSMMDGQLIQLEAEEKERKIGDFISELVDWDGEEKLMESMFAPLWRDTYDLGADEARKAYSLSVKRPELISFAKLHGAQHVKEITATTKESIRRIVSDGIEHGDSHEAMARAISEEMNIGAGRARVIAQTETHTSLMTGNHDMMKAAGISTKTWLTTGDGAVRDKHKMLNGQTVPIDGVFSNGLRYPGDPACTDPSQTVGCRCQVIAGDL